MFFCNSLAFSIIQQMLAIWSLVPLPFLNPAWTSGSSQFMYYRCYIVPAAAVPCELWRQSTLLCGTQLASCRTLFFFFFLWRLNYLMSAAPRRIVGECWVKCEFSSFLEWFLQYMYNCCYCFKTTPTIRIHRDGAVTEIYVFLEDSLCRTVGSSWAVTLRIGRLFLSFTFF